MVGKTSIYKRYLKGYFSQIPKQDRTVNSNCDTKYIAYNDKKICINIWVII